MLRVLEVKRSSKKLTSALRSKSAWGSAEKPGKSSYVDSKFSSVYVNKVMKLARLIAMSGEVLYLLPLENAKVNQQ